VFATANGVAPQARPYELVVLGLKKGPFTAESGLKVLPDLLLAQAPPLDTLIVPGGAGLRLNAKLRESIADWLRRNAPRVRRVASVCTGIYPLTESGLLDGRRATTHWRFAEDVAQRWPAVLLDPDAIYIKDGRYYTSAGISAGIDLALALVEEDLGNAIALAVARELVVYMKRSGGQLQYSEPLRVQSLAPGGFSEMLAWMHESLAKDLSVDVLAERAHMSARHFSRKFKAELGATPAEFVEILRLDESRWLLANLEFSIEALAAAVGYRSADAFRRAFERRFGLSPSDYRGRFGSSAVLAQKSDPTAPLRNTRAPEK
jgi:transcriptional regulator GlxA family with amidase domain